jgi:hypothetical protein
VARAINEQRQIAALDSGERAVAENLGDLLTPPELDAGDTKLLKPFIAWTMDRSCRCCEAKPHVVAAYVLDRHKAGVAEDQIFDELGAIERLHDHWQCPNPVATSVVDSAIEQITEIKPPRSWPAADKAVFATLDPQIRFRILTRENQRDVELRRLQNEYAEKLKALKPDEPKAVEQKEVTTNESIP